MGTASNQFIAHIRRLAANGVTLYIRIDSADIGRLGLEHGHRVEIDVGGSVSVRGVVKTSGSSPWLAPEPGMSNSVITAVLRGAGFEHGDNVLAVVRLCEFIGSPTLDTAGESTRTNQCRSQFSRSSQVSSLLRFDAETAIRAVRAYNGGQYRNCPNLHLDRAAYQRFSGGLPNDELALIDLVRFVGEDYGGAQRRFLPHSYRAEAELIVAKLRPVLNEWRVALAATHPLLEEVPDEITISFLLAPFAGTNCWPVWASKTLHFLRCGAFPIFDSRASKALGLARSSFRNSPGRSYQKFCFAFRDALIENGEALAAAREVDKGASPSDLKLLDKVLFVIGK